MQIVKLSNIMGKLGKLPEAKRQQFIRQNSHIIYTADFVSYLRAQIAKLNGEINAKNGRFSSLLPQKVRQNILHAKQQKKAHIVAVWESLDAVFIADSQSSAVQNTKTEAQNADFSETRSLLLCK